MKIEDFVVCVAMRRYERENMKREGHGNSQKGKYSHHKLLRSNYDSKNSSIWTLERFIFKWQEPANADEERSRESQKNQGARFRANSSVVLGGRPWSYKSYALSACWELYRVLHISVMLQIKNDERSCFQHMTHDMSDVKEHWLQSSSFCSSFPNPCVSILLIPRNVICVLL